MPGNGYVNGSENVQSSCRMRLEVLVAAPPTSKCKKVIGLMEEMVAAYPGKLKLDIYYAGSQLTTKPTRGFQVEGKSKKIPSSFVNGYQVASGEIPDPDELQEIVAREASKREEFWEQ
ncbi:MAG TPA: hypothetical protein VK469_01150 [Candidatus Kapabacteria bacterium]|nr:hypothetical protein [Candidatus Kapabacteria bacterium]